MARLTIYLRPIAERRQGGYAAGEDAVLPAKYVWHGTIKDYMDASLLLHGLN